MLRLAVSNTSPIQYPYQLGQIHINDGQARRIGRLLGLTMTGTVGILARAKRDGLIPQLASMLAQLEDLGFRLRADLKTSPRFSTM
jgi:predicted nucleic acid-binding protein